MLAPHPHEVLWHALRRRLQGRCHQRGGVVNVKAFFSEALGSALGSDRTPEDVIKHVTPSCSRPISEAAVARSSPRVGRIAGRRDARDRDDRRAELVRDIPAP